MLTTTTPRPAGPLLTIAMLLSVAWPSTAVAQKASDPGLGYMYPPVVTVGRTTDVTIAGSDWTPDLQVIVHDPRVTLETVGRPGSLLVPEPPFVVGPKAYSPPPLPREQRARITVPKDFPTGPVYWQVANANGASQVGVFFVIERPEVIEPADRSREIRLETLPVMVSGRLRRNEEIDRYLFTATRTGAVTCTLWARRIGSNFRGVLEVRDAKGKLLAQRADTTGHDLSLTFGVKQKQRYSVAVRELDFRGHRSYVYRLQVRDGGRVLATLPASVQRGTSRDVLVRIATGNGGTRTVSRGLSIAGDAPATVPLGLDGLPYTVPVSGLVETTEAQLRGAAVDGPVQFPGIPAAVTGELETPDQVDSWQFTAAKGRRVRIEVFAARLGGALDTSLELVGPDGKTVATADDVAGTTDARLALLLPSEGTYTLRLSDLAGRSARGHRVYRLVVGDDRPGFAVTAPQQVKLRLGGSLELPVKVTRSGGFDGPITLEVQGLSEGVTVTAGEEIPGDKSETKLKFQAAANAATLSRLIRIVSRTRVAGQDVEMPVLVPSGVNKAPRDSAEGLVPGILLTTTMKPRTTIRPVESDERTVHRGSTHPAPIRVERLEGFQGDVLVCLDGTQPAKFRQGLLAPDVIMPRGTNEVFVPCFVPQLAETLDAYRVSMVAVTRVKDPRGRTRYLLSKMNGNTSVAITVEGGLLTLGRTSDEPLRVKANNGFQLPVQLSRSAKLTESVRFDVSFPRSLEGKLKAGSLTTSRSGRIELPIARTGTAKLTGRHLLRVRALARQKFEMPRLDRSSGITPLEPQLLEILDSGHLPVIAGVSVEVDFGD
jgi:hypothetical protein